jgi:hypothetical protein
MPTEAEMAGREAVECIAGVGPHGDAAGTEVVRRELPYQLAVPVAHFGLANPVTVTRDGAGAVIAATFTTTPQQAAAALGAS